MYGRVLIFLPLCTGGFKTRPYVKIFLVLRPMLGIFNDVAADRCQFPFVADDAIMERTLPLKKAVGIFLVYCAGGEGFEGANDFG
jgi:hypothetical protein